MSTFTIDTDNNITAFGSAEEAAAATTTPFESFTTQKELTELAAAWPAERRVAIWNSLPGAQAVKGFKSAKSAAGRIWERIQKLGEAAPPEADAAKPETESAKPKAEKTAKRGAHAAKGAPVKAKAAKKTASAKAAPKAKKVADGSREGSKTAQVVAMLQRKNGATMRQHRDLEPELAD